MVKLNIKEITHEKEEILKELVNNTNPIEQEVLRNTYLDLNRQLIPKFDYKNFVILLIVIRNMPALKPSGILKKNFVRGVASACFYSYFCDLKERTIYKERNFNLDKEFDKITKI